MYLPTLTLDSFTESELEIVKPFITNTNVVKPRVEFSLADKHLYASLFVYQTLLTRLYRDSRFSVPVMWLADPFTNPFKRLVDQGYWRQFKSLLQVDPVELLKLVEKIIATVDSQFTYPPRD